MKPSTLLCLILATALTIVCVRQAFTPGSGQQADTATDTTRNAAIDNIMTRASVRTFTAQPVGSDTINILLRAGMAAPTAVDKRPWHFIAVTDKAQLAALAKANPYATFAAKAPVAIIVCGDMRYALEGKGRDNWVLDTSAATENILLAAHALGLGAVWTGVYPSTERMEAIAKVLKLPREVVPMSNIIIGYPAQKVAPKDKWDEQRVSYDTYQE